MRAQKKDKPKKTHPWRAWNPGALSDDRAKQHPALPGSNWTPIRRQR